MFSDQKWQIFLSVRPLWSFDLTNIESVDHIDSIEAVTRLETGKKGHFGVFQFTHTKYE